jgi:pimeloyl-ACP methyl ester carboxylesterase
MTARQRLFSLVVLMLCVAPVWAEDRLDGLQIGTGQSVTIVMLHGDEGRGGDVSGNFAFGAEIARRLPDATIHMLLRPGYEDPWGRRSPGENFGRRDQYTLENAALIAENLRRLRGDAPLIAVGHSGGAAQLALALSLDGGVVDEAILVACPCDLDLWREMNPNWPDGTLTRSVSATAVAAPTAARITLVTGEADTVTPAPLAESYARHVQEAGGMADLQIVPGGDHAGNRALSGAWLGAIFAARERVLAAGP